MSISKIKLRNLPYNVRSKLIVHQDDFIDEALLLIDDYKEINHENLINQIYNAKNMKNITGFNFVKLLKSAPNINYYLHIIKLSKLYPSPLGFTRNRDVIVDYVVSKENSRLRKKALAFILIYSLKEYKQFGFGLSTITKIIYSREDYFSRDLSICLLKKYACSEDILRILFNISRGTNREKQVNAILKVYKLIK
jgi:hypothetical protein